MAEKCESSNGQPIGCQRIQKMDAAIRWLFSPGGITTWICLLALLICGLFIFRTFWPISYPTEIRLDVRVDGGGAVSEKTKANVKLELSEALLAMEARAAAAYNEKFATLLTILTIFGIAWPVIIALLQSKFNESELKKIENAQEKAEESLKQANEAREKAQKCLDDIAKTNMRIYRYNGDVYYQLASSEAAKYSDLAKIDNSKKVDILYKFVFSIDSYIRATLAMKDDNACRKTVYTKINNMCDWINKIIPNLKSQFLMLEFSFLVSFFADIPDNGKEKVKIMERLQKIVSNLVEDCPEPEIFDPDGKH